MPPGAYAKPPITEAVIEFGFADSLSGDAMVKLMREATRTYPFAEETYEVGVKLNVALPGKAPETTATSKRVGYKLTGQDQNEILVISAERLATVRLPPYAGWEALLETTKSNFALLKKVAGFRRITRLATRYVNRIDIPREGREVIEVSDYCLLEPRTPAVLKQLHAFATQVTASTGDGYSVIVNTGTTVSPLIDHVSVLLDIDLYKDREIPQKEMDVWELLSDFRRQKDAIFEAFVTDRARELFDAA